MRKEPVVSNASELKKVVEAMYLLGVQSQGIEVVEKNDIDRCNKPNAYRLAKYLKEKMKINCTVIGNGMNIHLPYGRTNKFKNYNPYNCEKWVD